MKNLDQIKWSKRVVFFSLLLFFFNLPHTLEDFALGAPEEAGIPAPLLATVISLVFFLQAVGIYWIGQKKKRGAYVHVFLGLFWPIASGMAQLPVILTSNLYRAGMISKIYVFGIILVGLMILFTSIKTLSLSRSKR